MKVGLRLRRAGPGPDGAGGGLAPGAPDREHAYGRGRPGHAILSDEDPTLSRYRFGHDQSFDRASSWLYEGMAKAFSTNTARLAIAGDNPLLLSSQTRRKFRAPTAPTRPPISRRSKRSPISTSTGISSPIRAPPGPNWFFPMSPRTMAVANLAKAIFAASRVDRDARRRMGEAQ